MVMACRTAPTVSRTIRAAIEPAARKPARVPFGPRGFFIADNGVMENDPRAAAEAARQACIAAALAAYEDAGVLGLCAEGRWEAAIGAMQSLDVKGLARPEPEGGLEPEV
jgi:hypothetical protein